VGGLVGAEVGFGVVGAGVYIGPGLYSVVNHSVVVVSIVV